MSSPNFDLCLILHGCPPTEQNIIPKSKRWMNWLAEKLREMGFNAVAPDMPVPWNPRYEEWKKEFAKYPITENSILIGYSCGAAFLVRWLMETKKKVKKLILVAPAKIPENEADSRKDLYDFDLARNLSFIAHERIIFISNDFPRHLQSCALYEKALKAKVVTLKNKGHFLIYSMGTREFPELLEEIMKK